MPSPTLTSPEPPADLKPAARRRALARDGFRLKWFSNGRRVAGEPDAAVLPVKSTLIRPRHESFAKRMGEAWQYRRLLPYFSKQILSRLYVRTKLGWLWVPIRPVMEVGSRALVFGALLKAPSNGIPYFLFLLTGMTAWALFWRSLWWLTRSIEINRKLVRKLYFPRLLMPLGALVAAVIEFGIYLVLFAVTIVFYVITDGTTHMQIGVDTLLVLAGLGLLFVFAFGIGLVTAVLGSHGRDTRFTLNYVLNFWFLLSPIIYPLSAVGGGFRTALELNPVTAPMEMIREGLFGTGLVPTTALIVTVASAVASLAFGLWYFSRSEAASVDSL